MTHSWVEIDLDAVRHNVRAVASLLAPGTEIFAVVKADAYGHGAVPVARAALSAGAHRLAVAHPAEGASLRAAGIGAPILVLGGYDPDHADLLLRYGLTPLIGDARALHDLEVRARRVRGRIKVHMHVDTGMCRLGISPKKAAFLAANIARSPDVELEGVSTHLSTADEEDLEFSRLQVRRFRATVDALEAEGIRPRILHVASTAAILRFGSQLGFDAVRPGAALYGMTPSAHCRVPANGGVEPISLAPALTWKTRVVRVEKVPAGTPVSYGRTQTTGRETHIATLSVGYGDGYVRAMQAEGEVLIGGERHPLFGRVTMDHLMVNLGPTTRVRPGDVATLVGADGDHRITAEELTGRSGRIPYELATNLTARVERHYLGEETPALRTVNARR